MPRPHPRSTLFPYTTLFRSLCPEADRQAWIAGAAPRLVRAGRFQGHDRLDQQSRRVATGNRPEGVVPGRHRRADRKSTRLNSSHTVISYAVFCLKKKKEEKQ